MKILVIPDIHLKPWIVRLSVSIMNELIETEQTQPETERQDIGAVFLGDVANDFGKQEDLALYTETYDEVISFLNMFPASWFCIGNHDISYVWEKDEDGYSKNSAVQDLVRKKMTELEKTAGSDRYAYMFCIDNVIFSHAGLSKPFYNRYVRNCPAIETLIERINSSGVHELWAGASPIWARIQTGYLQDFAPYVCDRLQVVGHTPMAKVQYEEKYNLLSADVFSTQPDGKPVGEISDLRFVVVDTIEKTFSYADELVSCISPGQISSFYPQD